MKKETTTRHTVTISEILKALNIDGDVLKCGFNNHQGKGIKLLEREMVVITTAKKRGKKE